MHARNALPHILLVKPSLAFKAIHGLVMQLILHQAQASGRDIRDAVRLQVVSGSEAEQQALCAPRHVRRRVP